MTNKTKGTICAILLIILCVITGFALTCCTKKEILNSYICKGKVVRSAPGYLPDTTSYEMKKVDVTTEDILWFQNNRTYTLYEIWNGIPITTVSTMSCKLATCYTCNP
jgi:hypothetical protein